MATFIRDMHIIQQAVAKRVPSSQGETSRALSRIAYRTSKGPGEVKVYPGATGKAFKGETGN